jgi:DNA-binding CsgD family transcriptional regulator
VLAVSAMLHVEPRERVHAHARRAIEAGIAEDVTGSGAIWHPLSYALAFTDGFELLAAMVEDGLAEARRRGSLTGQARAHQSRAMLELRRGRLREAVADARVAIEAGRDVGLTGHVVAVGVTVEALVDLGDLSGATAVLAGGGLDGDVADGFLTPFALLARGRLRLAEGRRTEAISDLREIERRSSRWWRWNPAMYGHRSALALALGAGPEARRLVAEELALARAAGAPRAMGIALRAAGLLDGDLERLRESVQVLGGSDARLERARALVDVGAALRRAGRRSDAREPLQAGMDLAHRCGALPLVGRAHEELVAAGARPRRALLRGIDALTASELRVSRLAADGLTNREIAQALFVTLRTVELHLTHAYRKLDIASREQLAAALELSA